MPENNLEANNALIDVTSSSESLSLKEKAGDAANKWVAKNRSLVLRQTPLWAQSLALILIVLGSGSILAGIFFRIDEVVTASGQLKSIGGTVAVKTPAGGRISSIYFKDGDFVKKGDLLLVYDTRQILEERKTLSSLINLETEKRKNDLLSIESNKLSLNTQLIVANKQLSTKLEIFKDLEDLVKVGGLQRIQFLQLKDEIFAIENRITDIKERIVRAEIQSSNVKVNSRRTIDQLKNNLSQANFRLSYQNVVAPADGIIFDSQATSEGVLEPGERILSIVPQGGFYAEVFVTNKDIGYITIGQEADVRVDAFPFTRYGELNGKISHIGAEALPPTQIAPNYRFPIRIKLDESQLVSKDLIIPLKSGMSITSNLKLRDKPLISLISDVFIGQADSMKSLRQQ